MVTKENQDFIRKLHDAFSEAQQALDQLPLSVPGPIRDQYFGIIVSELMEKPHRSALCPECRARAESMAIAALGWQDPDAPRPPVEERMDALKKQMRIALDFLDTIEGEGRKNR